MLQMVRDLQAAGIGDSGRLLHIADTIARGRVVYRSDRQYVELKFAEISAGRTGRGKARGEPRPDTFNQSTSRAHGRPTYDSASYNEPKPDSGYSYDQTRGAAEPASHSPPSQPPPAVSVGRNTGRRTLFWVGIALLAFGALGLMIGPVLVVGGLGLVFEDVDYEEADLVPGDFLSMGAAAIFLGFPTLIIGIVMALIGRRK